MRTRSLVPDAIQAQQLSLDALRYTFWLTIALCASQAEAHPTAAPTDAIYVQLKDPSEFGLGFLANGRGLYAGGCKIYDLSTRSFGNTCLYPANTRWGHVSPDGRLLLATAIDPTSNGAVSYQIDAVDGRVKDSKRGLHFAPPVAIHPDNKTWAVVRAGLHRQASETIEVVGTDWRTLQRSIYGHASRIFDLKFSSDGATLLVNGGNLDDGALLSTTDWKPARVVTQPGAAALSLSQDGRFAARLQGRTVVVVEVATTETVASLDIDMSRDEPQSAFSPDGQWFAAKGFVAQGANQAYAVGIVKLNAR